MSKETKLRDRLAMSFSQASLPTLENEEALDYMEKELGLEFSEDPMNQIYFAFKYEAFMRYKYADIMMEARKDKKEL